MTITIDITPEVKAALARQAAAQGREVESYAASLLEQAVHPAAAPPTPPAKDMVELFAPLRGLNLDFAARFAITRFPICRVLSEPPRSGVAAPDASVRSTPRRIRLPRPQQFQPIEHHRGAQNGRDRIGNAFAGNVGGRAMHRLEHRRIRSLGIGVRAGGQPQPAGDNAAQVRQQIAEQIRRHDHVEPLRTANKVHRHRVAVLLVGDHARVIATHLLPRISSHST